MARVQLDGKSITDRAAFHAACKTAFGFPDFYGNNMDAWVDCLSGLRDNDGMSKFVLKPDEVLQIEVLHSGVLRGLAPEIIEVLEDCAAAVNERCIENGEKPALELVFR